MSTHVRVETVGDQTLACKRPTGPGGAERIRAQAARLATSSHAGLVRLVELREGDDGPILVTDYVGARTLDVAGPLGPERVGRLVADLADTVADLHAEGFVHGAIRPEHVLVAGQGTVLCSPAPTPDGTPADDVAGIGQVLRAGLDPELEEEPIPDRRPWRRVPWVGYRHRALLTIADQATDDDPRRRPSARALATAVRDAIGAPGPGVTAADPAPTEAIDRVGSLAALLDRLVLVLHPPRRRWRSPRPGSWRRSGGTVVAGGLGLLGAVVLVFGGASALGPDAGATGDPPSPAAAPPATTALPVDAGCPTGPEPGRLVQLDDDPCPERVRVAPGRLDVDGARFRVGRPGNDLTLGDWDCDGRSTLVLLRRGRGEVWHFPRWDPDGPVAAVPVVTVPGARSLATTADPPCTRLAVALPDGRVRSVAVP